MADNEFVTYEEVYGHPPDFMVSYRMRTLEEGGRKMPISQNYRCNWFYDGDEPVSGKSNLYSIYPQFLNDEGSVLIDEWAPPEGIASMWIPSPAMRSLHLDLDRIRIGTRGFMSEGPRPVVECVVTKIIAFHTNPIAPYEQPFKT